MTAERPPRVALVSWGLHLPAMVGYNRLSVCTADALAEQGADLVWVGLPAGIHPAMAARLTGRVHSLPPSAGRSILALQRAFVRAERHLKPDLWHVQTDEPVPLFAHRPVVVTCTGLPRWLRFIHLLRDRKTPGRFWGYQEVVPSRVAYQSMVRQWLLWKAWMRKAAHVIAISEYVRWELVHKFGVPERKISVAHLAADPLFFAERPPAELDTTRHKYELPPRFALAVASLAKTKNTPGLIELAVALARSEPRVPLVLVAPAGALAEYTARAAARGLTVGRDVFFLFNIPDADLACVYRLAEVFVNLAWEESFALPVVEAMAAGTPAVVSNTTALPEIVGDGGLSVDPRDPDGVARTVRDVLANPALRADLRARALKRAADFSWAETARRTRAVYHTVLRERGAG